MTARPDTASRAGAAAHAASDADGGAPGEPRPETVHASAVAVDGRGLLIFGAAGSGKTGLVLELLALGATLIADDRTELHPDGAGVAMRAPEAIAGLVEIRGAGILRVAERGASAPLWLAADLDRSASGRMPPRRSRRLCGVETPVLDIRDMPARAAALMAILRAGILPDPEFLPAGLSGPESGA